MTTKTIGSGLGASIIAAPQSVYGGTPNFTTARTITFKTAKLTHRQHPIQGGPYLRQGDFWDIGSARKNLWLDAMITLTGDVMNTGEALLLAAALGAPWASSSSPMVQLGTTTAYELGSSSGAGAGLPDTNLTLVDFQVNVPTADDAIQHTITYHSGIVTKMEFVFDKTTLVSKSYDIDFQYPELLTAQTLPSEPGGPVPFNMAGAAPVWKIGPYGAEATVTGVRKTTITFERKMSLERIYVGNQYKNLPTTNGNVDLKIAMDTDYTSTLKPALYDLQISGVAASIICQAVGGAIGSSGYFDTFGFNISNAFVDTGGEPTLDGPDLIHNTTSMSATKDAAADAPLTATLISADTSW